MNSLTISGEAAAWIAALVPTALRSRGRPDDDRCPRDQLIHRPIFSSAWAAARMAFVWLVVIALVAPAGAFHSGDHDHSWKIDPAELDRVIYLYGYYSGMTRTGQYHTQSGTVDGYERGPGTIVTYHASDYDSRNGRIGLLELTRFIELYNYDNSGTGRTGEYHVDSAGEDGFSSGAAPNTPPSFPATLGSQSAPMGGSVTFSTTLNGSTPIAFQWRKASSAISGATTGSLVVNNVQATDAGSYEVVATNSAGSATSNAATLSVMTDWNHKVYKFANVASGKVLDVTDSSLELGADVQQWDDNGVDNQKWALQEVGSGTYLAIESIRSAYVLDVRDWSSSNDYNGQPIEQWWKHGYYTVGNEQFQLLHLGNGRYNLVSYASQKLVTVSGASLANGAAVVQADAGGGDEQAWDLFEVTHAWSTPAYTPAFWNADYNLRSVNNCYNYGNNRRTDSFAQPGRASGQMITAVTVGEMQTRCNQDQLNGTTATAAAPNGQTKIVLYVGEISDGMGGTFWDFHLWRRDSNGMWSHKPGQTDATNLDASGNAISDPASCNRGAYDTLVGYFFTPSDSREGRGHGNAW